MKNQLKITKKIVNFVDVFSIVSFFSFCEKFPKAHALIPIDLSGDGNQRGYTQMFEGHTQQTMDHFKRGGTCCLKGRLNKQRLTSREGALVV
jgi:hypothetical protein